MNVKIHFNTSVKYKIRPSYRHETHKIYDDIK